MTIPDDVHPPADTTSRVQRDVAAVVLILLGTLGLCVALWQVDPWWLVVLGCLTAVGAGVYLGFERD